jgi:hypothetical protein
MLGHASSRMIGIRALRFAGRCAGARPGAARGIDAHSHLHVGDSRHAHERRSNTGHGYRGLVASKETIMRITLLGFAVALALGLPAHAADHRDSPLATNDPAADINDVYTFVNPNDPDELIAIVTVSPVANANTRFSDAVEYRLHLDQGDTGNLITCTFPDLATRVECRNADGSLNASGGLNRTNVGDGMRVWAGLRDDPFFFDLAAFIRTRDTLTPSFTSPGVNFFGSLDTLAIAIGIDTARIASAGDPVVKVHASTRRIDGAGVGGGFTGVWRDPANPGQGLLLEVLDGGADPAPDRLGVYWSTFTNAGEPINLFGVGEIAVNGTTASVPLSYNNSGFFPPITATPTPQAFGRAEFSFDDCNIGTMAVTPTRPGFAPVTVPLERLTSILGLPCELLSLGQIDRMGRPGINTALIDLLASTGKKDAYNQAANPATWAADFQGEIQANLAALDTLDGTTGNTLLPPAALAPVLVDDRLLVDTSAPSCDAYLAVELGVTGQCGGRTLARDVIDDTLGAIVGPGVSDNVGNDSSFLADFPFIGAPR